MLLAEDYRDIEYGSFNTNCSDIVNALENEPRFGNLLNAINIYRVNVESNESGTTAEAFFIENILSRVLERSKYKYPIIVHPKNSILLFHGVIGNA